MQAGRLNGRSNKELESAIQSLRYMLPETQKLIVPLLSQLAQAEGVSPHVEYRSPIKSIDSWGTKLKAERKSVRTIMLYSCLVRRFLKQVPAPTRADIREYLARRIEETSPSSVETERKTLASLFSFLYAEGLWHENHR
ncbi:site-specific integrase [Chloroflexota bacterium]